jgi:hypothetical protein
MKQLFVVAFALIFLIPMARTAFAAPDTQSLQAPQVSRVIPSQMTRLSVRGIVHSTETYSTAFPTRLVTANGWGEVSELGGFTVNYETEMNLLDLSASESVHFVGTNGNSIEAKGLGQAVEDPTSGIIQLVEIYTITGGTGRFKDASGTLTLKRVVNLATGSTAGALEGYILLP